MGKALRAAGGVSALALTAVLATGAPQASAAPVPALSYPSSCYTKSVWDVASFRTLVTGWCTGGGEYRLRIGCTNLSRTTYYILDGEWKSGGRPSQLVKCFYSTNIWVQGRWA